MWGAIVIPLPTPTTNYQTINSLFPPFLVHNSDYNSKKYFFAYKVLWGFPIVNEECSPISLSPSTPFTFIFRGGLIISQYVIPI